ncbi:MAG: RNA polymerase sigma factor [Deltaproteobacteria bacterium]|nr:RNA polymerase sigma factor [Deltaproteobacteria bacterium]
MDSVCVEAFACVSSDEDAVPGYVVRAQTGDTVAFRELYNAHRRRVTRLVARLAGPRRDLDDLVQEVFLQVFRSLPGFRRESRFSTWLHRVAVNVVLMHLRAQRCRVQASVELPQEHPDHGQDSPLAQAERHERQRALYRLLDRLSEKKRAVFILHDLEGLPPQEVATLVGSNVLTVRTRLFYARQELLAAMGRDPSLDRLARELQTDARAA